MIIAMKRIGFAIWITMIILIAWIFWYHADWMVIPPKLDAMPINDKDIQNSLPDPNRPYFDACGNEFDYMGNLISKGTGCDSAQPVMPAEGFQGK